jgi:hypothetical protein
VQKLATYPVEINDGKFICRFRDPKGAWHKTSAGDLLSPNAEPTLQMNEFFIQEVLPSQTRLVTVNHEPVAVLT